MSQCIKVGNVKQKSMTNTTLAAFFFFPLRYADVLFYTHHGLIFLREVRRQSERCWISSQCVTHANSYLLGAIKHLNTNMKLIQCVATFRKINRLEAFWMRSRIKHTKHVSIIFYLPACRSLVGIIFSHKTQAGFRKWLRSILSGLGEVDAWGTGKTPGCREDGSKTQMCQAPKRSHASILSSRMKQAQQSFFPETSLTFPTKQLPRRKGKISVNKEFQNSSCLTRICRGQDHQLFCPDYWGRASIILYSTVVKHCFPQGTSRARGSRTLISSPWQCPEGFVAREEHSRKRVILF